MVGSIPPIQTWITSNHEIRSDISWSWLHGSVSFTHHGDSVSYRSDTPKRVSLAVCGFGYWGPNIVRNLIGMGCDVSYIVDASEDYDRLISTILIGNNIVNISAASLTTSIAYQFGGSAIAVANAAITILILIFGEITPKTTAIMPVSPQNRPNQGIRRDGRRRLPQIRMPRYCRFRTLKPRRRAPI